MNINRIHMNPSEIVEGNVTGFIDLIQVCNFTLVSTTYVMVTSPLVYVRLMIYAYRFMSMVFRGIN